jgi:hypothetical protein
MLFNFNHNFFRLINVTLFSLLLSVCDEKINLLLELINSLEKLVSLEAGQVWLLHLLASAHS